MILRDIAALHPGSRPGLRLATPSTGAASPYKSIQELLVNPNLTELIKLESF